MYNKAKEIYQSSDDRVSARAFMTSVQMLHDQQWTRSLLQDQQSSDPFQGIYKTRTTPTAIKIWELAQTVVDMSSSSSERPPLWAAALTGLGEKNLNQKKSRFIVGSLLTKDRNGK